VREREREKGSLGKTLSFYLHPTGCLKILIPIKPSKNENSDFSITLKNCKNSAICPFAVVGRIA